MSFRSKSKHLTILAALVIGFLCSCQSMPDSSQFDNAPLLGVIFDGASRGVQGFSVSLDYKTNGSTDINGKFNFPAVSRGKHHLEAIKAGYQSISLDFNFDVRSQIVYMTALSFRDYLAQAESAMQRHDFLHAQEQVALALKLQAKDAVALYLLATIKVSLGAYADGYGILKDLLAANVHEVAVYLLLIDIAAQASQFHDEILKAISADSSISQIPAIAKALERIKSTPSKETP